MEVAGGLLLPAPTSTFAEELMASNSNFLCLGCRVAVRRPKTAKSPPSCPQCRGPCRDVGYKIAVPAKADVDAWKDLEVSLRESAHRHLLDEEEARVARVHALYPASFANACEVVCQAGGNLPVASRTVPRRFGPQALRRERSVQRIGVARSRMRPSAGRTHVPSRS
jgi:hypothetical protein